MTSKAVDPYLGESSLEEYVRGISNLPLYDSEQERALWAAARAGDDSALEALIVSHLRYVVDVALERREWGVPLAALVTAGNRGLVKAARRYDPDGGRSFLQYAVWWIRQEMVEVPEVA